MRRLPAPLAAAIAAIAFSLAVGTALSAAARTHITITPGHPIVDDDVVVKFRPVRPLPDGWRYVVAVTVRSSGGNPACTLWGQKRATKVRHGVVRVKVTSYDVPFERGHGEWCQGRANVRVLQEQITKSDTGRYTILGNRPFRFFGKP